MRSIVASCGRRTVAVRPQDPASAPTVGQHRVIGPGCPGPTGQRPVKVAFPGPCSRKDATPIWLSSVRNDSARSEEHTSELQSLMRTSYAVFCLKKKREYHTKYKNAQLYRT